MTAGRVVFTRQEDWKGHVRKSPFRALVAPQSRLRFRRGSCAGHGRRRWRERARAALHGRPRVHRRPWDRGPRPGRHALVRAPHRSRQTGRRFGQGEIRRRQQSHRRRRARRLGPAVWDSAARDPEVLPTVRTRGQRPRQSAVGRVGRGFGLLHLVRRLHRHQQPRRTGRQVRHRDDGRRPGPRREGHRDRPEDGRRRTEGQAGGRLPLCIVRQGCAENRRLGRRDRQSLRLGGHRDGGNPVG